MKKTHKGLIALAVSGLFSVPALAQSSIQLYGVADAFVKYGKWMGDDVAGVDDGGIDGSRLGFRGEESLGNGLKAVFVLEEGFNIDTGKSCCMTGADSSANSGSNVFTRQSYVGLKGSFGQVALGRQYAPGYFIDAYDALQSMTPSVQSWLSLLGNLTITPNAPARWNNAVAYNGEFNAVSFSAIYSAGNRESDSGRNLTVHGINVGRVDYSDDDKYGLSLKYDNGPLKVGAIYQEIKFGKDNGITDPASGNWANSDPTYGKFDKNQKEWLVGASYNFGMATLAGSYQKGKDVLGLNGLDVDLWQVGVIVPIGGGNFSLSYGQLKLDSGNYVMGDHSTKPKSFAAAYTYSLSKRTTAYVAYTHIDYDDLTWNQASLLGNDMNGHDGTKKVDNSDLLYVGLNHHF